MMEREVPMRLDARMSFIVIAALVSVLPAASPVSGKTVELTSHRIDQPIQVDGARIGWPDRSILFFSEEEVFIGATNDADNLYLILQFRNPDWARWIRMGGLTIYVDPEGKKGKDFKLKFTGGPTMKEITAASGKSGSGQDRRMPENSEGRGPGANDEVENPFLCYQKKYLAEKAIPMDGSEGPAAAGAMDKEFFVYEFSIPLKESTVKMFGLGAKPDKPIGVGFIWGDMEMKKPEGMGGRDMGGGGFPGGGGGGGGLPPGGGPGGGDFGGGGPDGGSGRRRGPGGMSTPEKQEIWVKVQLAGPDQKSSVEDK
ncbi:MAG: hypothetical protein GYA46_02605 [candidate division Zixibacteria bacterium]|nr:hypothetical protein [candidate division Zixibacteria bacterium]